jgi:hypothetical protein
MKKPPIGKPVESIHVKGQMEGQSLVFYDATATGASFLSLALAINLVYKASKF